MASSYADTHTQLKWLCQGYNRQRFVWKSLEQNTRVLEKLGKRLGGRLYSATVGASGLRSSWIVIARGEIAKQPRGSFGTEKENNEAVRPAKGGLSVWKSGSPFHPRGPAGGRCGTRNDGR